MKYSQASTPEKHIVPDKKNPHVPKKTCLPSHNGALEQTIIASVACCIQISIPQAQRENLLWFY
jgi:hypothetical protein